MLGTLSHSTLTHSLTHTHTAVKDKDGNLSVTKSLFGGMFSGCCSTFANNPFDMVKTRMQGIEAKEYKSTMDCFASVLRREGPLGFYKGTWGVLFSDLLPREC